ncbi:MAG: Txe/YoeB family addiction module toxin [Defluviitaleaceae bacterium]|nr:Txe/YoeB family addiction module toxin [Defluviitaleaceae bacterium]
MNVYFSKTAKKEYELWERSNPKTVDKIDELIIDILENGFLKGKGKPEQLRYFKNPVRFSRHINQADRLVYCPAGDDLLIVTCKGHYDDK